MDANWGDGSASYKGVALTYPPLPWSCFVIFASMMFLSSLQIRSTIKYFFRPSYRSITDLQYFLSQELPEENYGLIIFHGLLLVWLFPKVIWPLNQCWSIKKTSTVSQWSGPNFLKARPRDNLSKGWQNGGVMFLTLSGHQEEIPSEKALNCIITKFFFI